MLGQMLESDRHRAVTLEGQPPGQHLVEHHPDRIEIGGGSHGMALSLLGER